MVLLHEFTFPEFMYLRVVNPSTFVIKELRKAGRARKQNNFLKNKTSELD